MSVGRDAPIAAALPDGDVLVSGGQDNSNGNERSSAELYHPASGTFSATGSMGTGREIAAAATLPDGRVLVAGGYAQGYVALASAEIYDPSTGTFSPSSASLPEPRTYAAAASLPDGRVVIAGGVTQDAQGHPHLAASAVMFVPEAEASPPDVDFGHRTVDQAPVSRTLTVTDVGTQALQISGAALSGPDAGDFTVTSDGCASTTLSPARPATRAIPLRPCVLPTDPIYGRCVLSSTAQR